MRAEATGEFFTRRRSDKETARVLVAVGREIVRFGLTHILDGSQGVLAAAEAADAAEAISLCRSYRFDAVLLGLNTPPSPGLDALRAIRRERPEMPVLVFSRLPEAGYGVAALKAGASGLMSA